MAAGSLGDHPLTDLLIWGQHPFPPDMETMILKLRDVSPRYLDRIDIGEYVDWSNGKNLDAGREHLRGLLALYQADLDRLLNSKPASPDFKPGH
jgi:hypothetical protein